MGLRKKTILIALCCVAVFSLSMYNTLGFLLDDSYERLERNRLLMDIQRTENVLRMDIESIHAVIEDYAEWDDTYQFMQDHDLHYMDNNWPETVLVRFQLSNVVFLNNTGDLVTHRSRGEKEDAATELPPAILRILAEHQPLWQREIQQTSKLSALFPAADVPYAVAAHPILQNNGAGPSRGLIVAFRPLDTTALQRIARISGVLLQADRSSLPALAGEVDPGGTPVVELTATTITGRFLLRDIHGQPALPLSITEQRDISSNGAAAKNLSVGLVLAAGLVFSLLAVILLDAFLLRRLFILIDGIRHVIRTKDLSFRVSLPGGDELKHLSTMFNALLAVLQRSRKQLCSITERLEDTVNARTQELVEQYFHDPITGLPNRFQLEEDLRTHLSGCLAIINLDGFRTVNELFGHEAGDAVLKEVARRLIAQQKNAPVTLYRIGSDEFVLLNLEPTLSFEQFLLFAQTAHQKLESEPIILFQQQLPIFATLGLCCSANASLEKAQIAVHHARTKKSRFEIYDGELGLEAQHKENIFWLSELQDALHDNRLTIYFQPILNHHTQEVTKYEVLTRLVDRDGLILSPGKILAVAKKTNIYTQITEMVLRKSFDFFADKPDVGFSINMGPADIRNSKVRQLIRDLLSQSPAAHRVIFEFVESDEVDDFPALMDFIREVRQYGAQIAIDDFGSGYSNFANVVEMDVEYIKIDGSLIRQINTNPVAKVVVEQIIRFARSLDILVVAEFISSAELFAAVDAMGVDYSQGYFIGTPQPTLDLVPLPEHDSRTIATILRPLGSPAYRDADHPQGTQ